MDKPDILFVPPGAQVSGANPANSRRFQRRSCAAHQIASGFNHASPADFVIHKCEPCAGAYSAFLRRYSPVVIPVTSLNTRKKW